VTVRPVGGAAHAATLVLGTRRPAVWTAVAPGCLSSGDRTAVACDLGDLHESEPRTLRLVGRPGASGPAGVPVVARATADNVPAVSASLGAVRPAALRAGGRPSGGDSPAPDAGQSPSAESPPAGSPAGSPAAKSPAGESPAGESPAAQAVPDGSPPAGSPAAEPAAQPSESEAGPPASHAVRPLGGPARSAGHARPAPHRASAAAAAPSAAPEASAGPKPSPATGHGLPHAPTIPHAPAVPDVPGVPGAEGAAPPLPIIPGGPAVPLPGASASAALPQIAGKPSRDEGVSELNTVSPAGAMQAGRASWATLIAVAIVTEAGLLWLVAGLTVWRRKRVRKTAPRHRARSPHLRTSRPLP